MLMETQASRSALLVILWKRSPEQQSRSLDVSVNAARVDFLRIKSLLIFKELDLSGAWGSCSR
jgi:hypothetical protein